MSGCSQAQAVAALALEVHHAPARHAQLLRGNAPLPPGIATLLRLAGGTEPQELDPSLLSLAPVVELRGAALFFVEHVLFQREATHYRVLGLNQDARPEQIKEHHRLLMRLFHPDRGGQANARREQFATRANLAYNTLRDTDSRASYDSTLKPAVISAAPERRRSPAPVRRRMTHPESFWTVKVHPLLMRYLPQWVLAGTALVSLSVVGAVYLFNPPMHLDPGAEFPETPGFAEAEPASTDTSEAKRAEVGMASLGEGTANFGHGLAAAGESVNAAVEPAMDIPVEVPEAPAVAVTSEKAARSLAVASLLASSAPLAEVAPAPSAPVSRDRLAPVAAADYQARHIPKTRAAQKSVMSEPPGMATAERIAPLQTSLHAADPIAAPAVSEPEPVQAPVRAVVQAATTVESAQPPPLHDPNALLKRFLEAYERGDMQTCMAMFDDGLRTNAGGISETRREYDALFRGTDLRHIRILSMNWSRDGEFVWGEGRYRATQMRKGETQLRTQDGEIRIEMVRRGGMALISELYYLRSGRI